MQCSVNSIILTISLVLKLLSFCGFRALFLLLLQIKFPQWFVSFERQKMCVSYKMCAWACLLVCMRAGILLCVCVRARMHICIMYSCTFLHTSSCADRHVIFVCMYTLAWRLNICVCWVCALMYVCSFAYMCVCVVQRKWSDCYLQHA